MNPLTPILCGGLPGPADAGDTAVRLDRRPDGNLYLHAEGFRVPLVAPPAAGLLDLLDIAAYVYAADQAVARGGRRTRDGDHGWRRAFHFHIPLRQPERWEPTADDLAAVLGFLSDDDYRFTFAPLTDPPEHQPSLPFTGTPYDGEVIDEVALFSDGLDSLAGAAQLIASGRQPLLVTHRAISKLAGRQARLLDGLTELAGGRRPVHLAVRVNKDSDLTAETTQRSRSLLYAALGGLVAATVGKDRLLVFENGVLSLNLPPSGAVVGGRATRTTHPRVLAGFARLLSHAAGRPFRVENPFHTLTKTEVVRALAAAGGRGLIRWSTSCVHTWTMSDELPHCGACSQCLDRQFAVRAAGEEENDPADGYRADLVTGERDDDGAGLLAGYVEQATELGAMSHPVQFFARYGEATRAVRDDADPPAVAAERIYALYRRHAEQVNGVVDRALRDHVADIRAGRLPRTCLVRLVSDHGQVVHLPTEPADQLGDNVFRRRGEAWQVRFAGGEEFILLPAKGVSYLHHLLARPGTAVSATDLSPDTAPAEGAEDTQTDRQAVANYKERLDELNADIDKARTDNDPARLAEAESEKATLVAQLRADGGIGGRLRKVAGHGERTRKAVGNAIARVLERIAEYDPALAKQLVEPHLTLGSNPVYCPPDGVVWRTD